MNLPAFIIAGAPRAGTTYLYDVLASHPQVFMARPRSPEPKFFLVDQEFEKGLGYYATKYFAAAPSGSRIGEKSTNYLEGPAVAQRIHQSLPDAKLIFAVRNPIERAFSNYLWSKKNGLETLSFEEAVWNEPIREAGYAPEHRYSRPFSYVSRGMYASLLEPYLNLFGNSRVRIIFLEDVEANPVPVLDSLCEYLNVTPLGPYGDLGKINSARIGEESMDDRVRHRLREIYCEPNRRFSELIGRDLRHWT